MPANRPNAASWCCAPKPELLSTFPGFDPFGVQEHLDCPCSSPCNAKPLDTIDPHGVAVLWLQGNLPLPPDPAYLGQAFAQLGAGFVNIAVRSAEHFPALP